MQTLLENKPLMIGAGVVAILIGALLLLVIARMLFGGKLRMPGGRTRQARLGIVDAFDLDRQRQLIIVRRDNTEHLIMIGGPNDLVIESEIVRVEAREARDMRREKIEGPGPTLPLAPGFGEPRIAAPFGPIEAPEASGAFVVPQSAPSIAALGIPPVQVPPPVQAQPVQAQPVQAPPIQAPSPVVQPPVPPTPKVPDLVATPLDTVPPAPPRRTPTFPLPPRRPNGTPVERPTAPVEPPPRVDAKPTARSEPAGPSLDPGVVLPGPTEAPPAPVVEGPPPVAPPPIPSPVTPPPATPVAAAPVTTRPTPPPFLRPLPPRPKISPRTPSSQPAAGSPVPPAPSIPSQPIEPPAPVAPPKVETAPKDTLESLEEEMAKLLGRGSER